MEARVAGSSITIEEAVASGTGLLLSVGIETARLDAELLLGWVTAQTRAGLHAGWNRCLPIKEKARFDEAVRRRIRREPVAYIIGEREFWSLDFKVDRQLLIPRPETETVVEAGLELTEGSSPARAGDPFRILDLGTGSGAIAVSLAREKENSEIFATDISKMALNIARFNAERHRVDHRIRFLHGNAFEPVRSNQEFFDLIVSNPPYIRSGDIRSLPEEVKNWEPLSALDGGEDGLDFYRLILSQGRCLLRAEGLIVVEIGCDMAEEICRMIDRSGFYKEPLVRKDYAARDRVVVAQRSS